MTGAPIPEPFPEATSATVDAAGNFVSYPEPPRPSIPEDHLTEAERRVLEAHRAHPNATYRQLAMACQLPYTTVKHAADRLELPIRRARGVRQYAEQSAADIVAEAKQRGESLRDTLQEATRDEAERITRTFGLDGLSHEPLGKREADDAIAPLVALVRMAGQHLDDDILGKTNRAHVTPTIWSWDEEEATAVVELWLTLGRKNEQAAYSVRVALVAGELWKGGYIVGRSIVMTVLFYMQAGGFGW